MLQTKRNYLNLKSLSNLRNIIYNQNYSDEFMDAHLFCFIQKVDTINYYWGIKHEIVLEIISEAKTISLKRKDFNKVFNILRKNKNYTLSTEIIEENYKNKHFINAIARITLEE